MNSPNESVTDAQQQVVATSIVAELLIEAPSAATAFVLAGSLADYAARAVFEDDHLASSRPTLQLIRREHSLA
jgi:hypothetical protein